MFLFCIAAIVTLVDGEKAEEICTGLQGQKLLETEVTASVYPHDNLLCVAHLPFNLEDKDFFDIVSEFGGVERCFLLRSDSGTFHFFSNMETVQ